MADVATNGTLLSPLLSPASPRTHEGHAEPWVGKELRRIGSLTLPLLLQNIFSFLVPFIATAFVGHLGPAVLSSVVLASSLYNVTGYSIIVGLSAGMETLCGQAYGAKNYRMLGRILQRAMVVCLVCCIPIALLWVNIGPLLLEAHQDPEVAAGAARYLGLVYPNLVMIVVSSVLYKYLVAQRVVAPTTVASIITAALCPFFNWLLIFRLNLGLDGAAYANMLSQTTTAVVLLAYVIYRENAMAKDPNRTWPGLQLAKALEPKAVLQYLSYGGAAAAMICLEWWAYELIIILSGTIQENAGVAVSTMGLTFLISSLLYMGPMSFGNALNTRVANELGAGNALCARRVLQVVVVLVLSMEVCFVVLLWLCKGQVARIFTDDPDVTAAVGSVLPVLCIGVVGDGLTSVFGHALRGCGRQGIGALMNLIMWWGIVVPLAYYVGLVNGLGPWGFWLALSAGSSFQAVVFMLVLSRFDWSKEVQRARDLVALHRRASHDVAVPSPVHAKAAADDEEVAVAAVAAPEVTSLLSSEEVARLGTEGPEGRSHWEGAGTANGGHAQHETSDDVV